VGSATPDASFRIRSARPEDAAGARMMLPEVFREPLLPILFAARQDGIPAPLGVAALGYSIWGDKPAGFRFALAVAPPHRRRGVGRALVDAVIAEARRWDVAGLWAWNRVSDEAGGDFLRALGFACAKRFLHFEGDAVELHRVVHSLHERVARTGHLPPGLRVVSLREAPAEAVVRCHQRHLGGDAATLAARIAGHGPDPFAADYSVVLMAGDRVAGLGLYGWQNGIGRIDAFAIEPEWRGSASAVVLLDIGLERGLTTGVTRMRFSCWDDVLYTVKLASRAGGRVVGAEGQYVLDLRGPSGVA
jgi:GNAT superfamily N-acetyltransferase